MGKRARREYRDGLVRGILVLVVTLCVFVQERRGCVHRGYMYAGNVAQGAGDLITCHGETNEERSRCALYMDLKIRGRA
jgi:hypothetical protein